LSYQGKYESYSADQLNSLEASVPLLSAAAKQRFYNPNPSTTTLNRMDPLWRASIEKQHLVRTAMVQQVSVILSETVSGRVLVWVTASYTQTTQTDGDTFVQNNNLTVLLVNAPSTVTTGTGWQVSNWNDSPGIFQPQYPL
jgi:hypothetical protein